MGSIPGSGGSPGEGNSNPLQYSCLGNLMDKGNWQATVHGIKKNQTQLGDQTIATRTKEQTMMNNTINAIKNILEGINNRITEKEEQISELEDRMVKITAREQNKGKGMERNEDHLRDL